VHTQTLCALAHLDFRQIGTHDYAQLFLQTRQLALGPDARAEAFRRMVFNVAAANCDDHTKNVSFLLPKDGTWRLSPASDITHAYVPDNRWIHRHLMAVNGRTTAITRADVAEVGDRFAVPGTSAIVEQVLRVVAQWRTFADQAGVPEAAAEDVAGHIGTWASPLR
jgi:serine/threonine-protein kinase HipA